MSSNFLKLEHTDKNMKKQFSMYIYDRCSYHNLIKLNYYYCTIWLALTFVTLKDLLPVVAGVDVDVINDINVAAVNSEFLQQGLHPVIR